MANYRRLYYEYDTNDYIYGARTRVVDWHGWRVLFFIAHHYRPHKTVQLQYFYKVSNTAHAVSSLVWLALLWNSPRALPARAL